MNENDEAPTYPVVSAQGCSAIFAEIDSGIDSPDVERHVSRRSLAGFGIDTPIDFDSFVETLEAKKSIWDDFRTRGPLTDAARNRFEAESAPEIYEVLSSLPIPVLDDKDFWRWLLVGPLRWYVYACDSKDGKLPNESKGLGGDSNFRRNPVTRSYFRGRLAADVGLPGVASEYARASAARKNGEFADQDFMKSHILAIQVGNVPEIAAAFIRASSDPYLPTGDPKVGEFGVRQFVKYFTRLRSEVMWNSYERDEARALAAELRETFDRSTRTPTPPS